MKKYNLILLISLSILLTIVVSCASTVHCDAYGQVETPHKNKT